MVTECGAVVTEMVSRVAQASDERRLGDLVSKIAGQLERRLLLRRCQSEVRLKVVRMTEIAQALQRAGAIFELLVQRQRSLEQRNGLGVRA